MSFTVEVGVESVIFDKSFQFVNLKRLTNLLETYWGGKQHLKRQFAASWNELFIITKIR